jgi:predicted acetyltransferase
MTRLVLRALEAGDEEAFLRACGFAAAGDPSLAPYYQPEKSFETYLRVLEDGARGRGLPEGHVPSTLLAGFVDADIVGRLWIRHVLNESLLQYGGHVGYVVLPRYRRRGHAQEMLTQGLARARSMGLERVLLTCDEDNLASRRTIEKAGAEYEDSYVNPENTIRKRRYWITLSKA